MLSKQNKQHCTLQISWTCLWAEAILYIAVMYFHSAAISAQCYHCTVSVCQRMCVCVFHVWSQKQSDANKADLNMLISWNTMLLLGDWHSIRLYGSQLYLLSVDFGDCQKYACKCGTLFAGGFLALPSPKAIIRVRCNYFNIVVRQRGMDWESMVGRFEPSGNNSCQVFGNSHFNRGRGKHFAATNTQC